MECTFNTFPYSTNRWLYLVPILVHRIPPVCTTWPIPPPYKVWSCAPPPSPPGLITPSLQASSNGTTLATASVGGPRLNIAPSVGNLILVTNVPVSPQVRGEMEQRVKEGPVDL